MFEIKENQSFVLRMIGKSGDVLCISSKRIAVLASFKFAIYSIGSCPASHIIALIGLVGKAPDAIRIALLYMGLIIGKTFSLFLPAKEKPYNRRGTTKLDKFDQSSTICTLSP